MSMVPVAGVIILMLPIVAAVAVVIVAKALGISATESASSVGHVLNALLRRR